MALDPNQQQGLFGDSFVRVLASAAGLVVARAELDVTGDDFTISHKGVLGGTRHPKIDVQVKSWSRRGAVWKDGHWKYRMQAKHFNELTGMDFAQYIRTMPDGPSGSIPLHEGYLAITGVRDLFMAAATSAVSPE